MKRQAAPMSPFPGAKIRPYRISLSISAIRITSLGFFTLHGRYDDEESNIILTESSCIWRATSPATTPDAS